MTDYRKRPERTLAARVRDPASPPRPAARAHVRPPVPPDGRRLRSGVVRAFLILALGGLVACGDDGTTTPTPAEGTPVADASQSQSEGIHVGTVAVLDGRASSDPDGDALTFQWTLVAAPEGSAAEIALATDSLAGLDIDLEGAYRVTLLVRDAELTSAPDTVDLVATRGPPRVTLDDFEGSRTFGGRTIVLNESLTVTGSVDDPDADVTVNGSAATVTGTRYAADLLLSTGVNEVVVVATNGAGQTSTSDEVTFLGLSASLRVMSPRGLYGLVYPAGTPAQTEPLPVLVTGVATVSLVAPDPAVTVNGVAATVAPLGASCVVVRCFRFEATVPLPRGPNTVTAVSGALSSTTTPVIDYCLMTDRNVGVASEVGGQGNRCHEIDGCSVYLQSIGPLTPWLDLRNNPMPNAVRNQASTEFGDGEVPPQEFFVHGLPPARALPCNNHDVCYQTLGTTQAQCDDAMYDDMKLVCLRAYPPDVFAPVERAQCYTSAWVYYQGLRSLGADAFSERQEQYMIG